MLWLFTWLQCTSTFSSPIRAVPKDSQSILVVFTYTNVNFNSTTDKSFADKRERGCSLLEEVMLVPGRVPWVPVGS